MKLNIDITNIKSITSLKLELPINKGLYAITGENATGKSTLTMCAALLFYRFDVNQYFGRLTNDSKINFELSEQQQSITFNDGSVNKSGNINIKGFYEGSLIFGNRFRNTTYTALGKLDRIIDDDIEPADNFIRENLGLILRNDKHYYKDLFKLKTGLQNKYKLGGTPFFYMRNGRRINQAHMSTGENLMLSILHSLKLRIDDRGDINIPCVIFLDEIELALHSSSLRRLVKLLSEIAAQFNFAIYFSTHSIELIRDIKPERIFYVQKYINNSIDVLNPCYPAFATKNLYDGNMGYDTVILVEDDLARSIILNLLKNHNLLNNKLVSVLPCGGWQNVLRMSQDILQSNLLGDKSKIVVILDGDVQNSVPAFLEANNISRSIVLNFLPISSLEKYLKNNLYDNVNQQLSQELDNYVFHKVGLRTILQTYKNNGPYRKDDANGKELFDDLEHELISNGKNRDDLIEIIIRYISNNDSIRLEKIVSFLNSKI